MRTSLPRRRGGVSKPGRGATLSAPLLLVWCGAMLFGAAIIVCPAVFANGDEEWRSYGGDAGGMRFSPLKEIHRGNAHLLERAWTYHTGELDGGQGRPNRIAFQCTPLVVDGVLYLATPTNRVIALDAETGKERWVFDPKIVVTAADGMLRSRGVAYWEGDAPAGGATKRILFNTMDGRLMALDARTGEPCPDFGRNGAIDLRPGAADKFPNALFGMTSPPAVYQNLVIVGARLSDNLAEGPSGDVRAFDARSGRLVWRFHTVPHPGEFGHETWAGDSWKNRTGANVWSTMSVDAARGLVFLPLGSASPDFYGGDRRGANLFANSIVALDARTGKRVWHFQVVHHDLWDYDLPAQPNLVTVRREGRDVPAVAVVTKVGFVFLFHRETGQPLFPVKEQAVPPSGVPGEASWPTQPVPIKPAPLVRQTAITRDDLTDVTPESKQFCTKLYDSLIAGGLYTPFGLKSTLVYPGLFGGANWSGASFDPTTALLYVNVNELGSYAKVSPPEGGRRDVPRDASYFWDKNRLPCQRPPWGTLNAVDLNTGEVRWRVPLGVVEALAAKGIRDTGAPSLGGSIVTAGGLVFIGGTGDRRFRAFDAHTGKVLWEAKLEESGHATPITYQGRRNKKQYVVIAAGGGGYLSRQTADVLAAYALPDAPGKKNGDE